MTDTITTTRVPIELMIMGFIVYLAIARFLFGYLNLKDYQKNPTAQGIIVLCRVVFLIFTIMFTVMVQKTLFP